MTVLAITGIWPNNISIGFLIQRQYLKAKYQTADNKSTQLWTRSEQLDSDYDEGLSRIMTLNPYPPGPPPSGALPNAILHRYQNIRPLPRPHQDDHRIPSPNTTRISHIFQRPGALSLPPI